MSLFSDVAGNLRKVILLDYRVDQLARDFDALNKAHAETRERLIRIEIIIEEAQRAQDARRLPPA